MFPFALTNNLKFVSKNVTDNLNDNSIKDRIVQSISQALPNKTGLKINAIVVIEADNEQKRTICINEHFNSTLINSNTNNVTNINNNISNSSSNNIQITTAIPLTSGTNSLVNNTNSTGLLISQPSIFPATVDDLQALLQLANPALTRINGFDCSNSNNNNINNNNNNASNIHDNIINFNKSNNQNITNGNVNPKKENRGIIIANSDNIERHILNTSNGGQIKSLLDSTSESSSRKRKAEKPCRIPQYFPVDSSANNNNNNNNNNNSVNGLDLSINNIKFENRINNIDSSEPTDSKFLKSSAWAFSNTLDINSTNNGVQTITPKGKSNNNNNNSVSQIKSSGGGGGHKKSSKVFNCNQCKSQFNSLNSLCKHTFSDHRAFRCTFCGANFTQRSNLQRHSLKHVGFKPFICNVCNKSYYRKDHLVRHIEVSHPGCDPKMNITVKLSSSECLEYLEKMQNDKLNEMQMQTPTNNNAVMNYNNSNITLPVSNDDNNKANNMFNEPVVVKEEIDSVMDDSKDSKDVSSADLTQEEEEESPLIVEENIISEEVIKPTSSPDDASSPNNNQNISKVNSEDVVVTLPLKDEMILNTTTAAATEASVDTVPDDAISDSIINQSINNIKAEEENNAFQTPTVVTTTHIDNEYLPSSSSSLSQYPVGVDNQ